MFNFNLGKVLLGFSILLCVLLTACGGTVGKHQVVNPTPTKKAQPSPSPSKQMSWGVPNSIDPVHVGEGGLSILNIDCTATNFCMAMDSEGHFLTYNGTNWSKPVSLTGGVLSSSFSCASTKLCMAVDASGELFTYNGNTWKTTSNFNGGVFVTNISCKAINFCMIVDANGAYATYNGISWSKDISIDDTSIENISCISATFCLAYDANQKFLLYQNGNWSKPFVLADIKGAVIASFSCAVANFCAVTDNQGNILFYRNGSWTKPVDINTGNAFYPISCSSSKFCVAIAALANPASNQAGVNPILDTDKALIYNGASWKQDANIDPTDGEVSSISCASKDFCVAADTNGNSIIYS